MSLKLKLNLNTGNGVARAPSISTPAPTPGGTIRPKLKLTNGSNPSTPAPAEDIPKLKKTKAGRATKPSAKILESRKRIKAESDSDDDGSTIAVIPPTKKIKLQFNTGPKTSVVLKAKVKGKPPKRPPGEGYDSEASDREDDPFIEEEFVLRMVPGDDCEYLRTAIAEKKIGTPKSQGGPDIHMKFFHAEGRRAAITIRGRSYAATLVDLPCVIEGMKSWDRRGWWKSADICQMLWVFAPIKREEEAKTTPLPKIIDERTFQYPHGLTPPMHLARKRRFRKRISRTAIEAVEEAVEKLLEADVQAASSRWEMLDPDAGSRHGSRAYSPEDSEGGYAIGEDEYSEDEDAEGEADDPGYFGTMHVNGALDNLDEDMDADLEADLEAAMQEDSLGAASSVLNGGETPAIEVEDGEEDDSGDESLEGDEDDNDNVGTNEVDENEKARLAQVQGAREDIVDLERQLEVAHNQLAITSNPILRRRLDDNMRKLKVELQLKKSAIGEGEDD